MAKKIKNILFVMADQLRWDYLSCYGHPHLQTPNIDRLAKRGVRFDNAYVQSPVCGPSRASFYTGRTVFSHGSTWNHVPLPVGELTIGDYLSQAGLRTAVVGKSHLIRDTKGMERLGADGSKNLGYAVDEPGFDPYERDDGIHPTPLLKLSGNSLNYNDWLREKGYDSENPWNDYANSAEGPDGEVLSGWELRNSSLPARVKEEHSETAFMTGRARAFISEMGDAPWLCHLSYIKPHWPYIAPSPYHNMYGPKSFLPLQRDECELQDAHPVFEAFTQMRVSQTFSQDQTRETVLPGYMGLIRQIDDHLGALFDWLESEGKLDDTMIVFTSDHGDYLGDHWMGEKELFHEASVKVPLIICDPRPEADATRGTASDLLVEAIDLLPTFLDAVSAPPAGHRLEGRSLVPVLHGEKPDDWREAAFSEIDYAFYTAREMLNVGTSEARGYMIRTHQWKYVHFTGFRPQLFDLRNDPEEFHDLGPSADHEGTKQMMHNLLLERLTARKNRVTMADDFFDTLSIGDEDLGIRIGVW